jgi:hypothetical protein
MSTKDLDINNYTVNDLQIFLGLPENYSLDDLKNNEKEKIITIISSNNINETYKYEILQFINNAKKILSYKFDEPYNNNNNNNNDKNDTNNKPTEATPNINFNNIGKILNPLSNKQTLQTISLPNNNISGYGLKVKTSSYMFNTQFRNNFFNSFSSSCEFNFPGKIKNVLSIKLSALQIPNVMLTFYGLNGTNQIYIKEDTTNNEAYVRIPDGNYSITDYPLVLETALNSQVNGGGNRFKVSIDPFTNFTTISNTTYTFTMNIIKKNFISFSCNDYRFKQGSYLDYDSVDPKNPDMSPSMLYNTMGYYIGYRKTEYVGEDSYTSESMYDSVYTDYVYFALNDYNNNYGSVITGVLPNAVIAKNILALVPLTSGQFTTTFMNASDLIYKTRTYGAPVELTKFSIQMLNQYGELLDLYQSDYAFCIEVEHLYNISGGDEFTSK